MLGFCHVGKLLVEGQTAFEGREHHLESAFLRGRTPETLTSPLSDFGKNWKKVADVLLIVDKSIHHPPTFHIEVENLKDSGWICSRYIAPKTQPASEGPPSS